MTITIRRGERHYGPYEVQDVHRMLSDGSVTRSDLASLDGVEWTTVGQLPGFADQPGHAKVLEVTAADLVDSLPPAQIWNPNHAASLAVISLGVIGPAVHAMNWRRLGKPEEQKKAFGWVGAFAAAYLAIFWLGDRMIREDGSSYATAIVIGILFAWYFSHGRQQARYVKDLGPSRASFRSSKPLVLASLAILGGLLALYLPVVEQSRLEETAASLINERLRDRMGEDSLECVDLKLGKKLARDLWEAEGLLDNGMRLSMTVRKMEGDVVAVRVNPASFIPLGLTD